MELVSAAIIFSLSEIFRGVQGRLRCMPVTPTTNKKPAAWRQARVWHALLIFKCIALIQHRRVVCTRLGFWKAARECVALRLWILEKPSCRDAPHSRVIPTAHTYVPPLGTSRWERGRPREMDNSTMFGGSGVEGVFKLTILRRNKIDWRWRSLALQHVEGWGHHLDGVITGSVGQLWVGARSSPESVRTGRRWETAAPPHLALWQICQLNGQWSPLLLQLLKGKMSPEGQ